MKRLCLATFAAALVCGPLAYASTVTDLITFSASPFQGAPPAVTDSFTRTFDPSLSYTDQAAGLTVNSLSHTFSSPVAAGFDWTSGGTLLIGGLLDSVGATSFTGNDYELIVDGPLSNPGFAGFALNDAGGARTVYTFGTVNVSPVSTPEPSTFALLATGLAGGITAIRRRIA